MFEPSISTGVLSELRVEDAVKKLIDVGWRYFELYSVHLANMDKASSPRQMFINLRKICDESGAVIWTIHDNTQGVKPRRLAEWAQVLGVKWIVVHPIVEKSLEENLKVVQNWVRLVRGFNIGIAIENMHDMIPGVKDRRATGSIPSELLWLIENSDPDVVGVCWDTCHAYVQNINQYEAIKKLNQYLVHIHLNDNISRLEEQHLAPFEGNVNWREIIKALREINYKGVLNVEGGFSINRLPMHIRVIKLRYILDLIKMMVKYL